LLFFVQILALSLLTHAPDLPVAALTWEWTVPCTSEHFWNIQYGSMTLKGCEKLMKGCSSSVWTGGSYDGSRDAVRAKGKELHCRRCNKCTSSIFDLALRKPDVMVRRKGGYA
jgi:hypothetical protein